LWVTVQYLDGREELKPMGGWPWASTCYRAAAQQRAELAQAGEPGAKLGAEWRDKSIVFRCLPEGTDPRTLTLK
jgi:hypothetical protein